MLASRKQLLPIEENEVRLKQHTISPEQTY